MAVAAIAGFFCWPRKRDPAPAREPSSMHWLDLGEQHMAIAQAAASPRDTAFASWNLGLAYEELGYLERAAALMQACVDFERASHHPHAERDAARVSAMRARLAR